MARNCNACDDLRQNASSLIANKDVTETACASLGNNTGFDPSTSTKTCDDLHDANDCLVGNLADEVEAYDVCDWQDFMKKFIPNLWVTLKAMICAICGLWAKVEKLEKDVNKAWCWLNGITKSQNFAVSENNIKWFNGVKKNTDSNPDLSTPKITGNAYCGYMTGSIVLPSNFATKFPNSEMNTHGILLYEYRIKNSDFNLAYVWPGQMQEVASGKCIHAHIQRFDSKSSTKPYGAGNTGYASYSVPEGWTYLQVRMTSYDALPSTGKCTLAGVIPVRMNPNSFDC